MLMAQKHVLGVGLRGGATYYLQEITIEDIKPQFGVNVMLDLNYTCYFPVGANFDMGIRTGLSIGESTTALKGELHEQFTNTDYYGHQMDYTVDFNSVLEKDLQQQVELPIMLAMRGKGVVFNLGAKVMAPIWRRGTQKHAYPIINAYYPDYNVNVPNEVITGVLSNIYLMNRQRTWNAPRLNVMASLEFGYEWRFKRSNLIGLMATASISAYNTYSNPEPDGYILMVSDISDPIDPVPDVTLKTLSDAVVKSIRPFDFGIKLYYAFEWK